MIFTIFYINEFQKRTNTPSRQTLRAYALHSPSRRTASIHHPGIAPLPQDDDACSL